VSDGEDDASFFSREVVEEVDDVALGAWVETAGDLITEEEVWIRDEFHGKAESAFLASREDSYRAICDGGEAGFLENAINAPIEFLGATGFNSKLGRSLDGFVDGELIVGDRELWDVADFSRLEVSFFGEISSIPPEGAVGFRIQPCDGFKKRGFSAA